MLFFFKKTLLVVCGILYTNPGRTHFSLGRSTSTFVALAIYQLKVIRVWPLSKLLSSEMIYLASFPSLKSLGHSAFIGITRLLATTGFFQVLCVLACGQQGLSGISVSGFQQIL